MARLVVLVLYSAWAAAVGVSITAQLCVTVILNERSPSQKYHAFYVSVISILLGGLMLVPRCIQSPEAVKRPKYWWSMLGGMFTVTSFFSIPATMLMGVQLVLLVMLLATLSTALVFDVRRGRVSLSDPRRLAGLGLVLVGLLLDALPAWAAGSSTGTTTAVLLLLLAVFATGIGYGLQAKCNARLSRDLGSVSRATAFSAAVNTFCCLPFAAIIYFGLGVAPTLHTADWPLWMFAGLQSAFYVGSLAQLPKVLGYTAAYVVLLAGKLVSSSVADAMGLAGQRVPFSILRGVSLLLALAGAILFSAVRGPSGQVEDAQSAACEPSAELDLMSADGDNRQSSRHFSPNRPLCDPAQVSGVAVPSGRS